MRRGTSSWRMGRVCRWEGFCCRRCGAGGAAVVVDLRIGGLFPRLKEAGRHSESADRWRSLLLVTAWLAPSGRRKTLQISMSRRLWEQLRAGYERMRAWLAATPRG